MKKKRETTSLLLSSKCKFSLLAPSLSRQLVLILCLRRVIEQARVVQRLDNTIHRINHYPADSMVCFVKTYPLDNDLSGG